MASVAALTSRRLLEPNSLDGDRRDGRAQRAAETGAAADEPEQALGLPGVVDVVGQRPELADEQDARGSARRNRARRRPRRRRSAAGPRRATSSAARTDCVSGNHVLAGEAPDRTAVQVHQHADEDRRAIRTYGRLSDPSWSMNLDLVTGLRMLCDVIARNE